MKCENCGKELQINTKFCPECGAKVSGFSMQNDSTEFIQSEQKMVTKKTFARIIGIVGTLIAFAGMFFPAMTAYGQNATYYEILMKNGSTGSGVFCGILCFVVVELFLFGAEKSGFGSAFGIVAFLLLLFDAFGGETYGMSMGDIMNYLGIGFWIMSIGLIMMSAACLFKNKSFVENSI